MLSHYPSNSSPEWYDAALDQWHVCICDNCQCKNFQTVLSPPKYLCTSILLDDGRVLTAGGYEHTKGMRTANMFDPLLNQWHILPDMNYERTRPYVVQLGLRIYVVRKYFKYFYIFLLYNLLFLSVYLKTLQEAFKTHYFGKAFFKIFFYLKIIILI